MPTRARRVENMFSMRYLGDDNGPAPRLHDVRVDDPEAFLAKVLAWLEALARAGVVHGDLSAFNILVHQGEAWFIDLSEALRVDRTGGIPWIRLEQASQVLRLGMNALQTYLRKYDVAVEPEPFVERIVASLDKFGVLRRPS